MPKYFVDAFLIKWYKVIQFLIKWYPYCYVVSTYLTYLTSWPTKF